MTQRTFVSCLDVPSGGRAVRPNGSGCAPSFSSAPDGHKCLLSMMAAHTQDMPPARHGARPAFVQHRPSPGPTLEWPLRSIIPEYLGLQPDPRQRKAADRTRKHQVWLRAQRSFPSFRPRLLLSCHHRKGVQRTWLGPKAPRHTSDLLTSTKDLGRSGREGTEWFWGKSQGEVRVDAWCRQQWVFEGSDKR